MNEQFLELYRQLEGILRNKEMEYRDLEENSDDSMKNRLTITRQMRNFLSHNDDNKFLSASKEQIKFLQDLIKKVGVSDDPVKKHTLLLKKVGFTQFDKVSTVLEFMSKNKLETVLIISKGTKEKPLEVKKVGMFDLVKAYLQTKTAKVKDVKQLKPVMAIDINDEFKNVPSHTRDDVVVVLDKDNIIGYVKD